MDLDITYTFTIQEKTSVPNQYCSHIINWLKENLTNLTDDKNNNLFSKVNTGYNEDTLKGFGKKPVCDVYIDKINYSNELDSNHPSTINTFIICYLKGNMNHTYEKACELTDYIIQEFNTNINFRELKVDSYNIVADTYVRNVEFQIIPSGKTYGVLCAFELEHELC